MSDWINAYQSACNGATIDYQSVGSGAGVTDFINAQTDFAGSDSALKDGDEQSKADARCKTGKAIDIPMVGGAIALSYKVQGVDKLTLTSDTVAKIFAGKITKWNDPAIAKSNPGVTLPSSAILTIHRSDESGTTDNFTKFLKAAAPDVWTFQGGKAWTAPGGQGAKGNEGVSAALDSTPNSIGYVELSYAQNKKLATASIDNGGGAVEATSANASKALAGAKVVGEGNNLKLSIDYNIKDAGAYPVVLVTYEITCEKGLDADKVALVKSFLNYTASDEGQSKLSSTGYVPISGDLLTKVRTAIGAIS
ncbi:MAG: phosphate ABC transporter substrate-binding protein PstS [Motilibacteraceae bacterium]